MYKTSGPPLISLVGFTAEEIKNIKVAIEKARPCSKEDYLYIPLPPNGKYEYTDKYVDNFFRELKKRVIKHVSQRKEEYAAPGCLNLIYASQGNDQKLTDKCYKIFKIKKIDRIAYGKISDTVVISALQDKKFFQIDHIGKNNYMLLPFKNFFMHSDSSIEDLCLNNNLYIKENEIKSIKISSLKGRVFRDHKNIIFEPAKDYHGSIDIKNSNNNYEIVHSLAGMYRFGSPIIVGFHYHAQKENKNLSGITFYCAKRKTSYTVSSCCNYLNITPNDMVRE